MYATFERFELQMTKEQALSASQPGKDASEDVAELLKLPAIRRQLDKITPETIKAELSKYGAWDDIELADDQQNRARLVWIAACNIREELSEKGRVKS